MPVKLSQVNREIEVSNVAPSLSVEANFWFQTSTKTLFEKGATAWFPVGHGNQPFARRTFRVYSDFTGGLTGQEITSNASNGGTLGQVSSNNDPVRPGIALIGTGTTANTGRARLSGTLTQTIIGNNITWIMETPVRIITALSDGTNPYFVYSGFSNDHYIPPAHCVVGMYTHTNGSNTGVWRLVCRNANSESFADTDVPVVLNTWYRITTVVTNGTLAELYIDGVLKASVNTNIPTASGRNTTFFTGITKNGAGGVAQRQCEVDYIECLGIFANSR